MTASHPRLPAGAANHRSLIGGRFTHKPVPDITNSNPVGFNNDGDAVVGPMCDWDQRTVTVRGLQTTFTRTVNKNGMVTVTTDCDPPDMLLLAKKGDASYWCDDVYTDQPGLWSADPKDRQLWCADIVRRMLEEGLVATRNEPDNTGLFKAMVAAGSRNPQTGDTYTHALTETVAQIRGLRLIESMSPADGIGTQLGGWDIPDETFDLLLSHVGRALLIYDSLPRPPWGDDVPWGAQTVAGHATRSDGDDCFVGEKGDLLWRALTETTTTGLSPLKAAMQDRYFLDADGKEMVAAAVLYDETAAAQLTTGLFTGFDESKHRTLQVNTLDLLAAAADPHSGQSRWNNKQRSELHGFMRVVDGLIDTPGGWRHVIGS